MSSSISLIGEGCTGCVRCPSALLGSGVAVQQYIGLYFHWTIVPRGYRPILLSVCGNTILVMGPYCAVALNPGNNAQLRLDKCKLSLYQLIRVAAPQIIIRDAPSNPR